tara:strand:- start:589 stop:1134 length:546 start_codon:yes stop_codon:yes gene_type:complete
MLNMAEAQNKSIGILGGSFDPVHKGHLIISKIAIRKIKLKKLYWVVTKKNPFKKKAFFSLKERLFKTKKITKKQKNIEVLYLDKIVRSSKSIDTIKYIIKKNYSKKLYFLIGSDNLINFHKWKNWKKIVKMVKLVVFSRKGYDKRGKESIVAKYLNKKNIIFINNQHIKFSSTKIRKKINR